MLLAGCNLSWRQNVSLTRSHILARQMCGNMQYTLWWSLAILSAFSAWHFFNKAIFKIKQLPWNNIFPWKSWIRSSILAKHIYRHWHISIYMAHIYIHTYIHTNLQYVLFYPFLKFSLLLIFILRKNCFKQFHSCKIHLPGLFQYFTYISNDILSYWHIAYITINIHYYAFITWFFKSTCSKDMGSHSKGLYFIVLLLCIVTSNNENFSK